MNFKKLGYWIATLLIALVMLGGGAADFMLVESVTQTMDHLGYPHYFAQLLGAWKVLGAIAIVVPGFPRLKEWAYAGIFFDLTGAFVSHLAVGDGAAQAVPPLVIAIILIASYALRGARDEEWKS
jgi:uncharacterized membrane protein YphA (DoxX/SURF4 family)